MTTTIDKAGRVVIPAAVRQRLGFRPGMTIDITVDETSVRLTREAQPPGLVRRRGWLVARPTAPKKNIPVIDVEALIEEERNRWP
jgi:AbrB family looped-hinge helix DNA binding protein